MDIGTAKPSRKELAMVCHRLVDIINPDDDFSLAQFQQLARQAITDIGWRNKLPLLVGGSGLYVWSVVEGWGIPQVPPAAELRHRLEATAAGFGSEKLYRELERVDPAAAERIDRRNVRRLIRAIEIQQSAGDTRRQSSSTLPPYDSLIIGLTAERGELYSRIDRRVDEMIQQGLVDEVKGLLARGYSPYLPAMSGIGYRQIVQFLGGELALEAAVQQIKYESHRFVRQQYNWFKLKDDRIRWFDIAGNILPEITRLVKGFIAEETTAG